MQQTSRSTQRKTKDIAHPTLSTKTEPAPRLTVRKIGIVSRDYTKYANGFRDFSRAFPRVLKVLDDKGCDTVLFSPWSIVSRKSFDPFRALGGLKRIKSVVYEEFIDGKKPHGLRMVVINRRSKGWREGMNYREGASPSCEGHGRQRSAKLQAIYGTYCRDGFWATAAS